MSKFRVLVAVALLAGGAAAPASAQIVANGGFEQPATTGYVYNPSSAFWTFTGGTGIIHANIVPWNAPSTSVGQGNQFAFLQANVRRGYAGTISQSISIASNGSYFLSFLNASRGADRKSVV